MKGNKMSAILAILLMLTGLVAIVPLAHSQPITQVEPIGALSPSTTMYNNAANKTAPTPNYSVVWSPSLPGTHFTVQIWAYNINQSDPMSGMSIGFYFNDTILQLVSGSVVLGSAWNDWVFPAAGVAIPGLIVNNSVPLGELQYYTWSLYSTDVPNAMFCMPYTWCNLLNVTFEFNPLLTSATAELGVPHLMVGFTTVATDPCATSFIDQADNDLTPYGHITNGTVTITSPPPERPVANSVITPGWNAGTLTSTVTLGTQQTFSGATSTPGWSGTATVSITEYEWNWNNGTITYTTSPTLLSYYAAAGSYTVTLTVYAWTPNNSYNMSSLPENQYVIVMVPAKLCQITLYTQPWRYVDPFFIPTTYQGVTIAGENNTQADSFRPGDLVQLFANVTYNGAPVSGALVTFQVFNVSGTTWLTATAVSDCYGVAEWDFRIPWPENSPLVNETNPFIGNTVSESPGENTSLFGMWNVYATWQCGNPSETRPFETTQACHISFDVSWGLTITEITSPTVTTKVERGPDSCGYGQSVQIKVNVFNEYLEPVNGTLIATVYDNLLVPIYPTVSVYESFAVGWNNGILIGSVAIPSYAYVGTGYVVVNLLTTWPILAGTAFCPALIQPFQIVPY